MTSLKDALNVRVRKKGTKSVITVAVLLLTFCPLSACAPVLTIHSPDGDIIECINTLDQPSLNNPLLKKHVFQVCFACVYSEESFKGFCIRRNLKIKHEVLHIVKLNFFTESHMFQTYKQSQF
ncbi:unnamed protein product [Brassica rapa subsp. trilocularis]